MIEATTALGHPPIHSAAIADECARRQLIDTP